MRIATTNATTDPSTRHLPTNGTRERSDVCSAMAVAVAVGARNLPLLVAVELERRSTSVDLASSSFLDGIFRLRGPLPSMLSVVRGVVHAVGKQASMHCSRTGTIGSVRQTQARARFGSGFDHFPGRGEGLYLVRTKSLPCLAKYLVIHM